jgi:hypothetical protein
LIEKSQEKKKFAELFFKVDRQPGTVIGFNPETNKFINSPQHEISLDVFLKVCANNFQRNYSEIELQMKNAFR